jgi:hypothetical protein
VQPAKSLHERYRWSDLTLKTAHGNIQGHHGRLEPAPTLDGRLQLPTVRARVLQRMLHRPSTIDCITDLIQNL